MTCQLIAYNKKTLTYSTLEQEDEEGAHNKYPLHVLPTRAAEGQLLRGENRGKKNTTKGGEQGRAVTLEQGDEEGAQQVSTARIADARCGRTAAARREQRKEKHLQREGSREGRYLYPSPPLIIIRIIIFIGFITIRYPTITSDTSRTL